MFIVFTITRLNTRGEGIIGAPKMQNNFQFTIKM